MKIQVDRITDLGTFLYEISNCLEKEGSALQCLARTWYEPGDPEHITIRQFGIDISDLGEQLMALKKQLCTLSQTSLRLSLPEKQFLVSSAFLVHFSLRLSEIDCFREKVVYRPM